MLYTFENYGFLFLAFMFLLTMNILGYMTKKACFSLITTLLSLASLAVHVHFKTALHHAYILNVMIDLFFLGFSMVNMIILDEIETRRAILRNVFGNKYKK